MKLKTFIELSPTILLWAVSILSVFAVATGSKVIVFMTFFLTLLAIIIAVYISNYNDEYLRQQKIKLYGEKDEKYL